MHLSTLLSHLILFSGSLAVPTDFSRSYAVKERHIVPRDWNVVSRSPKDRNVNLHIGLKHRNQDILEQHALEVSDRRHARYGQYMSASEVRDLIAPPTEVVDMVRDWLAEHDISDAVLSPSRDSLNMVLPIEKVEELLATTYSVYRHEDGTTLVRTPEWSLPEYLHEYIDVVQPTNSFFRTKKQATTHRDTTVLERDVAGWGPVSQSAACIGNSLTGNYSGVSPMHLHRIFPHHPATLVWFAMLLGQIWQVTWSKPPLSSVCAACMAPWTMFPKFLTRMRLAFVTI